ncbi:hypothetical protein [Microbacterium testaceum]
MASARNSDSMAYLCSSPDGDIGMNNDAQAVVPQANTLADPTFRGQRVVEKQKVQ